LWSRPYQVDPKSLFNGVCPKSRLGGKIRRKHTGFQLGPRKKILVAAQLCTQNRGDGHRKKDYNAPFLAEM